MTFQLILINFKGFKEILRVLNFPASSNCLRSLYYILIHCKQAKIPKGHAYYSSKLVYS